jgi:hypothetical protein
MIFQNLKAYIKNKMIRNLYLKLSVNVSEVFLTAAAALLIAWPAGAFAAPKTEIEIGFPEVSVKQIIETSVFDQNSGARPAWESGGDPLQLRLPLAPVPLEPPPLILTDIDKYKHLMKRAAAKIKKGPAPKRFAMNEVLEAGDGGSGAAIFIERMGRGSRIAVSDGVVTIEPYLPTGGKVWYVIKLFDAGGGEIQFSGKPLLWWFRPDGKQNFPLYYKGVVKPDSVYLHDTQGNYNATRNLKYTFDIKKGQRIEASTKGDPMKDAYMKVSSPVFGAGQ